MTKYIRLFIILSLLGSTAAVQTLHGKTPGNKTINTPAPIRSVTVYPDRALVTREFHTSLEPGRYTLEFLSIPMNLQDKSLRVKARGTAAAKILDIKEKTITLTPPPDKVKQLETNIQTIDIQLKQLDDSKRILDKKEKYLEYLLQKTLDSISNTNPDSKSTKPFSSTDYKNMPDFMETQLNASLKKRWELDDKKRILTEKKNQLQTELDRLNGEKGTVSKNESGDARGLCDQSQEPQGTNGGGHGQGPGPGIERRKDRDQRGNDLSQRIETERGRDKERDSLMETHPGTGRRENDHGQIHGHPPQRNRDSKILAFGDQEPF